MKYSKGGGGSVQMDKHKGVNGGNIQAMGTSNYFIVHQVVLLGVSDNCVKNVCPVPMNIYIQIPMDWITHPALDL